MNKESSVGLKSIKIRSKGGDNGTDEDMGFDGKLKEDTVFIRGRRQEILKEQRKSYVENMNSTKSKVICYN